MKIYVGGLSLEVTDEDLNQAFAAFGQVASATVIKDKSSGESRGFGFVEMSSSEEAEKSKDALNNTEFNDRPLKIDEAKPQKPRRDFGDNRKRY